MQIVALQFVDTVVVFTQRRGVDIWGGPPPLTMSLCHLRTCVPIKILVSFVDIHYVDAFVSA